jgi:hypothetical protein
MLFAGPTFEGADAESADDISPADGLEDPIGQIKMNMPKSSRAYFIPFVSVSCPQATGVKGDQSPNHSSCRRDDLQPNLSCLFLTLISNNFS